MKNEEVVKLAALHRHWIVADSVYAVLKQKVVTPKQEVEVVKKFGQEYLLFGEHASMICRMQVWYSLLFVVIEGYKALGAKYEPLDQILAKDTYVDLLRRFRNATFHYQADPLNDKLIDFLDKKESEDWIKDLNMKLRDFFMQALPINETLKKIEENGIPTIPSGSKLDVLMQTGKQ
jgi:hypothetical protein